MTYANQPVAPGARVRIVQLAREFDLFFHLCVGCVALLKGRGWQVRVNRAPPFADFRCDCCEKGLI